MCLLPLATLHSDSEQLVSHFPDSNVYRAGEISRCLYDEVVALPNPSYTFLFYSPASEKYKPASVDTSGLS
jgi:hypothetical protein